MICSFCGKDVALVLHGGIRGVAICVTCTHHATVNPDLPDEEIICAFCGRTPQHSWIPFRRRHIRLIGKKPDSRICSICARSVSRYFLREGQEPELDDESHKET